MNKLLIILSLCFGLTSQGLAQEHIKKKKELSLGMGASSYNGDLGDGYQAGSLMGSVGIKLNSEKRLHGNFHLIFGAVSGQELDYHFPGDEAATPNTYFSSNYFGAHYELTFNIVNKEKLKCFLSQGVGFIRFQPKDQYGEKLVDQPVTREFGEDYRNIAIILPTHLGIRYKLNNGYWVGLQTGFLNPMTDYLDNISRWGNKSGNDNIWDNRLLLFIPIKF